MVGTSQKTPPPSKPAVIDGEALLGGRSEIQIRLGETLYRLRKTRQGKLILNK